MRPLSFLFVQFWRWTYPSKVGPLGRKGVEGRQLSYTAALKILEKLYTSVHCTTLNGVYPMCSLKTQTMFFPPKEKGNFLVFGDQIVTSGVYIRTLLIIWAPAGCHDGWWVGSSHWEQTESRAQEYFPDQSIMLHGWPDRLGMIWTAHDCPFKSLSELGWWMHGRGVGQTAGRAVRPSSTCLEAGAKQLARHITATSSSHMVERSLRKSLPTFAHNSKPLRFLFTLYNVVHFSGQ